MASGFFHSTELQIVKPANSEVALCGACGLFRDCQSPKIPLIGQGKKKVMLVGEAPGKDEDADGVPFIGQSGQYLRGVLSELGIDAERDCWITNSVICRPHTTSDKNRTPTSNEVDYCRPNLFKELNSLKPDVVILLGGVAVQSLIGGIWKKEASDGIGKWVGWKIPIHKPNMWVCPTWHPSYLIRSDGDPVLSRFYREHLENAFSISGKPWQTPPDYNSQIKKIRDPEEAAEAIWEIIRGKPKLAAIDYETTTLKPEGKHSRIVSCSLSDGETTIAYPWHGPTIAATKEFIKSKEIGKVASNMKFENRWTMHEFGHKMFNWKWDTMLAAHALDNRSGICGLKFQSFVLLGQPSYDEHISPYLKSERSGCNEPNRVTEIGLSQLLLYNGLDSLLEMEVAKIQMKQMGVTV